MKYMTKIAWINVVKKKRRTYLSLMAILLSTAIIYTSLTLFINVINFSKNTNYETIGNYHYVTSQTEDIPLSSRYLVTKDANTGYYGSYMGYNINLRTLGVSQDEHLILPFHLLEGRLPQSKNEILIDNHLNKKIGETIMINVSYIEELTTDELYNLPLNMSDNTKAYEMEIVGVYESNAFYEEKTKQYLPMYTVLDNISDYVYYVKDDQVHLASSALTFSEKMNVSIDYIINNKDVITIDTMKIYMQDTTLILVIFILIILISLGMSLISLHNVILISDEARKKELGLLKSVGAGPKAIKYLLQVELSILGVFGSMLGIVVGMIISYYVLKSFVDKIYVVFSISLISHPIVILVSLLIGYLLMYISGMRAYKKYIVSIPIEDLKDTPFEYAKAVDEKNNKENNASWHLFLIYNQRMKAQTRNIKYSLMLLLVTAILFSSIALSNLVYKNTYREEEYDFVITNVTTDEVGMIDMDFDFAYALYDEKEKGNIGIKSVFVERLGATGFLTQPKDYNQDAFDHHLQYLQQDMFIGKDSMGVEWCDIFYYPTILDQRQIELFERYLLSEDDSPSSFTTHETYDVDGTLSDLNSKEYILLTCKLLFSDESYVCRAIKAGMLLGTYPLQYGIDIDDRDIIKENNVVRKIVYVDELDGLDDYYFPFKNYPRVLAKVGNDSSDKDYHGSESFKITLKNDAMAPDFQERLDQIIIETNTQHIYKYQNIATTIETMKFTIFIIEVLLYPLFMMLFIISIMNLYNVFSGNVQLKRSDISILKSIGIKNRQVYKMFSFEYLEGYLNGSFIVGLLFVVLVWIESKVMTNSALDLGSNIIGTLMVALFVLGPILILPLALITTLNVKKIKPIENMKDME